MRKFVSKVQYANYETGEFSLKRLRNAEESIALLNNFPWKQNYQIVSVELTCPSVMIEHPNGNFLKIGYYFNGKLCAYLWNKKGSLSSKVINNLQDGGKVITDFYNDVDLSINAEKSNFVFNAKKHFVTRSFTYSTTVRRVVKFLLYPTGFLTLLTLAMLTGFFNTITFTTIGLLVTIAFFLIFNGFNFFLFFNYYCFSKDLYLRVSKGHNNFFFGTKSSYKEFYKTEIQNIKQYYNNRPRNPWGDNMIYEITFKSGEKIKFPNLLLGTDAFDNKFSEQKIERVHKFLASIDY
ncbi:MAG: hypothetical protein ACOH2A_12640 [Sphingobacteriaceae bacterium]